MKTAVIYYSKSVKALLPDSEITDYFYTSMTKKADADSRLNGIRF